MPDPPQATPFASTTDVRHAFSVAMSDVYRTEVPLYSDLLSLVGDVNNSFLESNPSVRRHMEETDQLERLHYERHGAIRLGTAEEMKMMARFFAIMGMQPVGYYDLSQPPARLPVHATCFRCLDLESLSMNPFRVFVSLLRPECISSNLRSKAFKILSRRQIFSSRCLELIELAERQAGLSAAEADEFIKEGLETFKWRGTSTVSLSEYSDLQAESALLADIVAFPGPHINHLTPRTLDIDQVQISMEKNGIPVKEVIEGPPARDCPILLRQTSFKALKEGVYFPTYGDDGSRSETVLGSHTARFGEIEQRGAALTEKGRALYDHLVNEAWKKGVTPQDPEAYKDLFKSFPDTWKDIRSQSLAWFRYYPVKDATKDGEDSIEELIRNGKVAYEPLTYEDFLPLSAAGIFRSNLRTTSAGDENESVTVTGDDGRDELQKAVKRVIVDEFVTYRMLQQESLEDCKVHFALTT
ncbi:uncharacterized protein JN550_007585 [Neoarthrinium moseri]|uniref:uncharacterized protein n=1 Tax=Neoarthrinium moseri TaxID=1658444 RepID=UPI001FDB11A6|nr:uncharacterized protein JN550_007585 [Neoarthrinium moseri]KAI1866732.1 hypothetical protein JN550_007585 [Neoarthrinium moseri]